MRNARAHKLQWSGPTVHSSTVIMCTCYYAGVRASINTNPKIESLNPKIESLNPKIESLNPKIESSNFKIESVNPKMESLNPEIESLNPKIESLNPKIDINYISVHRCSQDLIIQS